MHGSDYIIRHVYNLMIVYHYELYEINTPQSSRKTFLATCPVGLVTDQAH